MGRGDKKTKKGKIAMGSYGTTRPRNPEKAASVAKPEKVAKKKPAAAKK